MRTVTIIDSGAISTFDVHRFGSGSPHIVFTAGVHGNEYGGIYVAERLLELFGQNPPQRGTVTIIPRCNPAASRCGTRRSPFDSVDMNRIFPGSVQGSITYKVAAAVWEETANADYIVDLHCCGQHGTPYVLSTFEEHPKAGALAQMITLDVVIRSEGTPGQLFTSSCRERGQAAIVIEIPSGPATGAIHEAATEQVYQSVLDLLRAMEILPGQVRGTAPVFYGPLADVNVPEAGLWKPSACKGTIADSGHVLGRMGDQDVIMPEKGVIMTVRPKGYLFADDLWAVIYAPAL